MTNLVKATEIRTVTLEWDWTDKFDLTGYLVHYGTKAQERYQAGHTATDAAYWLEVWESRTYESFRDELLSAERNAQDVPFHAFFTRDGYPAFVQFYANDTAWTIHHMTL